MQPPTLHYLKRLWPSKKAQGLSSRRKSTRMRSVSADVCSYNSCLTTSISNVNVYSWLAFMLWCFCLGWKLVLNTLHRKWKSCSTATKQTTGMKHVATPVLEQNTNTLNSRYKTTTKKDFKLKTLKYSEHIYLTVSVVHCTGRTHFGQTTSWSSLLLHQTPWGTSKLQQF